MKKGFADDKRRAMLEELRLEMNGLRDERRHLTNRQRLLKQCTPAPGCEQVVRNAIRRYGREIADLNRRIALLEANIEGLRR